jgi:copper chaperone
MLINELPEANAMISFQVNDMTCGHCVTSITNALQATDRNAKVAIDLSRHVVRIEHGECGSQALGDAIRKAGYTPVELQSVSFAPTAVPSGRACCGCK